VSRRRLLFILAFLVALPAAAQIAGTNWFPIGPAPIDGFFAGGCSGRATAIAVNPMNASDVWAGTAGGGVWHTVDAGAHWTPMSDHEASLAIGAIALDGCSAAGCGIVYAGTGEDAIRRDTYYGRGLLIGQSSGGEFPQFVWTLRTGTPFDFNFANINDVILDPLTSGGSKRIFITLSTGVTAASPESTVTTPAPAGGAGIYRSDDNGATWTKLTVAGQNGALPTDLKMHPTDHNTLFAGFSGRGVFQSIDGGNTWCPLNQGIVAPGGCPAQHLPDISSPVFDHVEVAFAPSNHMVLYATFGRCVDRLIQNCRPAVWRSQNGGNTWTMQNSGDPQDSQADLDGMAKGYSRYTHVLTVDPAQENTLILSGVALWRSTDGGQTYATTDHNLLGGSVHSDHHDIVFAPNLPSRVYLSNDGGFAVSNDGGNNWTPINQTVQTVEFQSIGSSPLTGAVIGASQDNSGQLWNGSSHWMNLPCCGDGGYSLLDRDDVMTMYVGTNFGEVTKSTTGGASFVDVSSGTWSSDPRLFYAPIVQAPTVDSSGKHPIYFGTNRLFRTQNGGGNWIPVSPILATGSSSEIVTAPSWNAQLMNPTGGQNVITAIAIAQSDPKIVYVGYYGGQLFRSTTAMAPCDMASCWTPASGGLPSAPITRIAVHPTSPMTAYATVSGFGAFAHVWMTTNGGSSWTPIVTGLPAGVPANTIALEPSFPTNVYLGLDSTPTGSSLFKSTNGGAMWSAFADGLPNVPVDEISIDQTHGRAYAGTHGRGAFVLGKPFISNFEGWVHDMIWDIPIYGHNFPTNVPCKVQVLQSNGNVCASGMVDVMGGTINTDGMGVLQTTAGGMWNGHPVAWACFDGTCMGGVPISSCYSDSDGDGIADPLSSIVVSCGGSIATATVVGCPPLNNPPSSFLDLGLSGLPGGPGPAGGILQVSAEVQRRVGTASFCTVAVPYKRAESADTILDRARDLINASPTCAAGHVRAFVNRGHPGPSEDEFSLPPRLQFETPGVIGGQLITGLHIDPGSGAGNCARVGGLGVPVLNQIQVVKIDVMTPAAGAAGGTITITEQSPIGNCTLSIPTLPGEGRAQIAQKVVSAVQAPGIPGPHPGCTADHNPRDIANRGGSLVTVFAQSIEVCTTDPRIGFDLRSEELANVHPVANAGADRVIASGTPVALDGSHSSDPDSTPGTNDDIVHYDWFDVTSGTPVLIASTETATIPLADGLHRVRLRVTDKGGLSDTAESLVSIGGSGGGILPPGGATLTPGKLLWSFHVGSAHPLGGTNGTSDANIHVRADAGYALTDRIRLLGMLGFSQLTAESSAGIAHPHFLNLSADAQGIFPISASTAGFLEGGPGVYWSKGGGGNFGFNLGGGFQFALNAPYRLEIGADYHRVPSRRDQFLTLQFGVLFR